MSGSHLKAPGFAGGYLLLASLRLRPTRRVYWRSHSGGSGALIDAFIERRSYDSLALPKLFLGSPRGHRLSWHSTVQSNASVIGRAQHHPTRFMHHCLREPSRSRKMKFVPTSANLTQSSPSAPTQALLARLRLRPTRRVSVGVMGRLSRRSEAEPGRAFGTKATGGQAFV